MDARAHYLLAQHREAQVGKGEAAGKLVKLSARGVSVFGRLVKGGIMELMILAAVVLAIVAVVIAAVRGDSAEAARETESRRRLAAERQQAAAERAEAAADAVGEIARTQAAFWAAWDVGIAATARAERAEAALAAAKADARTAANLAAVRGVALEWHQGRK